MLGSSTHMVEMAFWFFETASMQSIAVYYLVFDQSGSLISGKFQPRCDR